MDNRKRNGQMGNYRKQRSLDRGNRIRERSNANKEFNRMNMSDPEFWRRDGILNPLMGLSQKDAKRLLKQMKNKRPMTPEDVERDHQTYLEWLKENKKDLDKLFERL